MFQRISAAGVESCKTDSYLFSF